HVGGHQLRAEYSGDVNFRPSSGQRPVPATTSNQSGNGSTVFLRTVGSDAGLNWTFQLNKATGARPAGSPNPNWQASFFTDEDGSQDLSGQFRPIAIQGNSSSGVLREATLAVPGGTVTGYLSSPGTTTGR